MELGIRVATDALMAKALDTVLGFTMTAIVQALEGLEEDGGMDSDAPTALEKRAAGRVAGYGMETEPGVGMVMDTAGKTPIMTAVGMAMEAEQLTILNGYAINNDL